jgi:hypothetical protein
MLTRVTITGADDNSDPHQLIELSRRFPFVEWGILVSRHSGGTPRFPRHEWIDNFCSAVTGYPIDISMHLCGGRVREFLVGKLDWDALPSVRKICQRVQINTHGYEHSSTTGLWKSMDRCPGKELIFQWDGVNDHLTFAALAHGGNVSALFDLSGGAGRLPSSWPEPISGVSCGYAGGLGPENVVEQLRKIDNVCKEKSGRMVAVNSRPFWIDMERRVRTFDDSHLDMDLVEKVLKRSEAFIAVGESL